MISIVVPVYNVLHVMDICVESVLNQTYRDFELILVDDESTDGSRERCLWWQEQDERIVAVLSKHATLGPTRNMGVSLAKGDYLAFVDSDDWVAPNFLECLLDAAVRENAEIAVCDTFYAWPAETGYTFQAARMTAHYSQAADGCLTGAMNVSLCNKLYKRDVFIHKEAVMPARYCEDLSVMPVLFSKVRKIAVVRTPLYFYRQGRANSIMASSVQIRDIIDALQCTWSFFQTKLNTERYAGALSRLFTAHLHSNINMIAARETCRPADFKYLVQKQMTTHFPSLPTPSAIVIGSYGLRRLASYAFGSPAYLECFNFSSLISLMSEPASGETPKHDSWYRQDMLTKDWEKSFATNREQFSHCGDILLDLLEERFDIWEFEGCYVTASDALQESGQPLPSNARLIKSGSEEFLSLWHATCSRFARFLGEHFAEKRIWIVENYLMAQYGDLSPEHPFEGSDAIKETNAMLAGLYADLSATLPNARLIFCKDQALCYSDKDFAFGCAPWHANEYYYRETANQIIPTLDQTADGNGAHCSTNVLH